MQPNCDIQTIRTLVRSMTDEEKATLVTGAGWWETAELRRLGIPAIQMADGPHGLRKEREKRETELFAESEPATCFPTASALACSFDPELLGEVGAAIGREAAAAGVSLVLGPGVNLKRSPLCGRNFEYFSEDPLLAGRLGAAYIAGLQAEGVGACLKHYCLNNPETQRFISSSNADERTMRESYLRPFEIAVREAAPVSVMSSYNLVNGEYVGESSRLLGDLLRGEWGFKGAVISDWGAVNDRVASLAAGLDLEMPGGYTDRTAELMEALQTGALRRWQLDAAAENILALVARCGARRAGPPPADLFAADHRLAARAASESCVLLKNENGVLPLRRQGQRIAVIGHMALHPRIQGGGSSRVNSRAVTSLLGELDSRRIAYAYAEGCLADGSTNEELLTAAKEAAASSERAVVVIGLPDDYENEGCDRTTLALPDGMLRLVSVVAGACGDTVVVLLTGAPVELTFCDKVSGLLLAGLGGQGAGAGLADVLFGAHNPSGRLAESWPVRLADLPNAESFARQYGRADYFEGIYFGYRYFEAAGVPVRFPFGFGLSYSRFSLGVPVLSAGRIAAGGSVTLTLSVCNQSVLPGTETVLVFAAPPSGGKKLAAFGKLALFPGEKQTLTLSVSADDIGYYHTGTHRFELEPGDYTLSVCGANETVNAVLAADGGIAPPPYITPQPGMADREALPRLLGHTVPDRAVRPYSLNSTVAEIRRTLIGKVVYSIIEKQVLAGKDAPDPAAMRALPDMPLRALLAHAGGAFTRRQAEGIVDMANGRWLRGLKKVL